MNAKKARRLRKMAGIMGIPDKMAKRIYKGMDTKKKAEIKKLPIFKITQNEQTKGTGQEDKNK